MSHKDSEAQKKYNREYQKKYRENNKEYLKEWREGNKERRQDSRFRLRYGITKEEYDLMVKQQNNRCALCDRFETNVNYSSGKIIALSVDHNHITGKNRALLCSDCNCGLGMFEENIELLEKAILYLRKHEEING